MKKRKICVVINNRANYARIKSALIAIKKNKKLELQIVLGSSAILDRYGSVSEVIKKDGFKINRTVYTLVEGENLLTMSKSTGISIMEFSTVFSELRPDMVIVIADRYETLAAAIAASYMNIKIAHIQAGDKSGHIDDLARSAIAKFSHLHFAPSKEACKRLINWGEDKKRVFFTGAPQLNFLDLKKIDDDYKKDYYLIIFHPVLKEKEKIQEQIKI